jgi:leucyl aminopeptidase
MPIRLPFEQLLVPVRQSGARVTAASLGSHPSAVLLLPQKPSAAVWDALPHGALLKPLFADKVRNAGDFFHVRVGAQAQTVLVVASLDPARSAFEHLQAAAKWSRLALEGEPASVLVWQQGCDASADAGATPAGAAVAAAADAAQLALIAALQAAAFRLASFKSKPKAASPLTQIEIARPGKGSPGKLQDLDATLASAAGNNLARWLTALPPNYLDARGYRRLLQEFARHLKLGFKFYGEAELRRLGAGAFLAVCSGNANRDAGIAYLSYRPRRTARARAAMARGAAPAQVSLVGKGICFDTGGTNLKPHKSMLDMHTDMEGSAVALGSLYALHYLRSPLELDCWLAITENRIGPTAYKPQDVVRALNGVTIQVIHTDAEGRMVLADALSLAATKKPRAIIDYATLTGACVYALTERYSGAFTNRPATRAAIEAAGTSSGERVWCFPMDADFDTDIDSSVADVMQCAVEGRGDHILAARFLNRFVPADIAWLHLDLAAGMRHGGLAHITTDITGFGVRYTLELLRGGWPNHSAAS